MKQQPASTRALVSLVATGLMEEKPKDFPTRDAAEAEAESLLWQVEAAAHNRSIGALKRLYLVRAEGRD